MSNDSEQPPAEPELLKPSEAGRLLGVDPKTVSRWAKAGKLSSIRTLGGHHRFRADEIHRIFQERKEERTE